MINKLLFFLVLFTNVVCASEVLIIGDSITLSAKRCLQQKMPDSTIDSKVGRQFQDVVSVLKNYSNGNFKVVVISLGTNGRIHKQTLERTIQTLLEKKVMVIFVNNSVPREWEKWNNSLLEEISHKYGIVVIDWKKRTTTKSGLLRSDKVHLTSTGVNEYCNLLSTEVSGLLHK